VNEHSFSCLIAHAQSSFSLEYWAELSAEHKKIPEHRKWMYSADPFAAKKEVADRQKKAAAKNESAQEASTAGPSSRPPAASKSRNEFSSLQQVKMATDLREFVEDAIKKVCFHAHQS